MCMARIVLVIDDAEKAVWVEEAHKEMVSLSEWIRRAGRNRARSYISERPTMIRVSHKEELDSIKLVAYAEPAGEASGVPPSPTSATTGSADLESPSSAPLCRRHKIHHLYHSGRPCPLCNYPSQEG